jgi:hypothetical protein
VHRPDLIRACEEKGTDREVKGRRERGGMSKKTTQIVGKTRERETKRAGPWRGRGMEQDVVRCR